MALKKYISSSWVDISYRRYENATDAVTNLPVTIYTDGQPVSSYNIKGNITVSSGTPSPSTPITISGVGDLITSGEHSGQYEISISSNDTSLTPVYVTEQLIKINDYADSLSSNGTVTYNVKKIVLTGTEEGWMIESGMTYVLSITDQMPTSYANAISTHYVMADSYNNLLNTNNTFSVSRRPAVFIHDDTLTTVDALKTYLASQYANGTPVIVYYVIETATTETVTAPSILTTGGEVTLNTETTVKPSEFDLTYHGWHSHEPKKYENGSWN